MFPSLPSLEGGPLARPVSRATEFNSSLVLARVLDRRLGGDGDGAGPLEVALSRSDGLAAAVGSLSSNQRQALEQGLGSSALREIVNLAEESDPTLFQSELMSFASRQEVAGGVELAANLYQALRDSQGGASALRERAGQRLDAILGRGAIGLRSESLLRNLAQQACDPTALLAMGVAGTVFRVTRLAALSRLAASPTANFLTRGFGARLVAGGLGFAAEATAFPLSGRLASEALGRSQDWGGTALRRDLASSFLVLGGLRLAGAAGAGLYGRFGGGNELARGAFAQSSMFAGILGGHWLEAQFGLRPHVSGATALVDSLATLVQFNVGGRLSHHLLGERVAAWERALDAQTELLAHSNSRAAGPRVPRWVPALATAGAGETAPGSGRDRAADLGLGMQVFMSKMDEGQGIGNSSSGGEAIGVVVPGGADPNKLDRNISDLLLSAGGNFEKSLRVFIDGLPFATAVANMDRKSSESLGQFFMVNRRFRELFGYTEQEIGEVPLRNFFHPMKDIFVLARIPTAVISGIFDPANMHLKHRDGHWVPIRGAGVVREVGERRIAFGFLTPREEASRAAQQEIIDVFQSSKQAGKRNPVTNNDGYIEAESVVALSSQLTSNNSALLQQIVDQNVKIRITNMPWVNDIDSYSAPLLRFFNVQARKFEFPTGRRVLVEFPASPNRSAALITLVKWEEGFRVVGEGGATAAAVGNGSGTNTVNPPTLFGDLANAGYQAPRSTPSVLPPREEAPPAAISPAVIDSGTAETLARLQEGLGQGLRGAASNIARADVEVSVRGRFDSAYLLNNREAIAGELQSITKQQKLTMPLGRQIAVVFETDRGPLRMVFKKVLGKFEPVAE